MTLCQLIKAIDDFNGKFGISGAGDVFFLYSGVNQYARLLGLFAMQGNTHIRLMVGLLLLKQLENLSDERVVLQFKRNPYYQYFCGYSNYMPGMPCNATELNHVPTLKKRVRSCPLIHLSF
jgi:hypothetical protein